MTREPPGMRPGGASERPAVSARHRVLTLIVALSAIGAFGGVVWYAYGERDTVTADSVVVPLIRADEAPLKVRPEDPGGMRVPHQDKLVYDRIAPGAGLPAQAERLLPPPEIPLPPPPPPPPRVSAAPALPPASQAPATDAPATDAPASGPAVAAGADGPAEAGVPGDADDQIAALIEEQASADQEEPTEPDAAIQEGEPATVASGPVPIPVTRPAALAARARQLAATPPAPPPVAQPPATRPPASQVPAPAAGSGGYRVQFAAVRSEEEARQEWARIRGTHGTLLASLSLNVDRADLGERGVFFRVQAAPLADAAAARSLCATLESRNQPCLVVAP